MAHTNFSTYQAIKQELLEMLRTKEFKDNKLPSEAELSKQLGISLVTLREALSMLAKEGYITKSHGSGNYVHKSTLDFENRSMLYLDNLAVGGHEASVRMVKQSVVPCSKNAEEDLGLESGELVLRSENLYEQDGVPAIYVVLEQPIKFFNRDDYENMDFSHLHEMIWKYCGLTFAHSLNEYIPINPDDHIAELFHLEKTDPLMMNKQVFYDSKDVPVMFSRSYFCPGLYKLRTLQNWALI